MNRDNELWLAHLSSTGADQQAALSDLRVHLLRGLRVALAKRGNNNDAFLEDAVQESLLRILARLRQFEGRSQFLTWAMAIAIRVAMSEWRRQHWRNVSLDAVFADNDFIPESIADDVMGLDSQWEQQAVLDRMYRVIRTELTEKQRAALFAELKGMPMDEIARHLGSNRNAVYKLTHDARRRLKRGIEAAGYRAGDIHAAFAE
ncbi:MAG: sigma-70 family RNA polymerase sigma factor [Candidatus Competibacteraceae bacterium]|jgi:RNA polymerase sigma-70 factor (ECF subfamily)|nr:sigma-70 family RNA polymerase sigma factor [Candidatus Competibacteraceae bacterium]